MNAGVRLEIAGALQEKEGQTLHLPTEGLGWGDDRAGNKTAAEAPKNHKPE